MENLLDLFPYKNSDGGGSNKPISCQKDCQTTVIFPPHLPQLKLSNALFHYQTKVLKPGAIDELINAMQSQTKVLMISLMFYYK